MDWGEEEGAGTGVGCRVPSLGTSLTRHSTTVGQQSLPAARVP